MSQQSRMRPALARACVALAICFPAVAPAQDPAPGIPADDPAIAAPLEEAPEDIEAITVTGEQIDVTDVQDEAQAITRFDMDDLDKLNISNVDGLAANVPGLHVGQQGQAAIITLRGVGTENASITGEPGVAFHVDGISFGRPTAARVAFFDLQMIDVRRGPQGLLGGKNSTSGSINVVTNDPSADYEAKADVLFGNYDRVRARGHVNLPLGEAAALRTAFFYEDRDGYLDNGLVSDSRDPFDADNFGFRTKLRLSPSEGLDLILGYNYFKETGNGPQSDLVPVPKGVDPCPASANAPPGFTTVLPISLACASSGQPPNRVHTPAVEDGDPRKIFANELASQSNRYWGLHGRLEWDVPELPGLGLTRLDLRGGYQRTKTAFAYDFDGSSRAFFDLDTAGLTHEYSTDVRWSGALLDERLEWQTSLFFQRETSESRTINPSIQVTNLSTGPASVNIRAIRTNQEVENKSYGAALHGSYHIGNTVTFSLGGRWIKDEKSSLLSRILGSSQEVCVGGPDTRPVRLPDGTIGFLPAPECTLTDRGTMWGARLEWRPTEDHLIYAGLDRGYKSGGFGLGGVGGYLPEKIWAYTLGTKSEFFDRRVQTRLEGFFYAYDDMQIALIDGTKTRTENSDTRMYGVELETTAMPIEGLRLSGLISYLHTETIDYYSLDPASLNPEDIQLLVKREDSERFGEDYREANCFVVELRRNVPCGTLADKDGLRDFTGNELSRSPEWKVTLSAEYEIPMGRFGYLTPRVQYTWQDDTYYRVFNQAFDLQDDYHKTDAKLIWDSPEGRWSAEVFVENIEDEAVKDFILIGSRAFNAPPLAWYSAPRFYGVRFGFTY